MAFGGKGNLDGRLEYSFKNDGIIEVCRSKKLDAQKVKQVLIISPTNIAYMMKQSENLTSQLPNSTFQLPNSTSQLPNSRSQPPPKTM
jgi:hypothetical protein